MFGQWRKLALARGFMRDEPLLLVLDEPTAALDAETARALFERYAAAARGGAVLDGSRVAQVGSHEDLMAMGGPCAELYAIQAAAYRQSPRTRANVSLE